MNWKFAFRALTAELHLRADATASEKNAMVKCGAERAEVTDARAQAYRWIAQELELLTEHSTGREALAKIRKWAEDPRRPQ